jgi:hypothetical protein
MNGQRDKVIDISLARSLCLSGEKILQIASFTDHTASHDGL